MPNVREALVAMLRPYAGTTSTQQTRSTLVTECRQILQRAGIDDVLPIVVPMDGGQPALLLISSTTGDALDVPTVYEVLSKPVPTGPSN